MKIHSFLFRVSLICVGFAVGLSPSGSLKAQTVPALVNYQGKLTNPDGTPLATGDYQLSFRVYNSATNSSGIVWGPQVFDGAAAQGHGTLIPVIQGYFNVMLGPVDIDGDSLVDAFSASNRFVEITISNRPPILPRQQILAAPYALNSAKLAGADWSAVFGANDPVNGRIPTAKLATNGTIIAQQVGVGTSNPQGALDVNGAVTATSFSGNGASLTSLNASGLASGTVPDGRLSGNVELLNANQTVTGSRTYDNSVSMNQSLTVGTSNLAVKANHSVGIGTSNPQTTLHVNGTEIHSSGPLAGLSFNDRAQGNVFTSTPTPGDRWEWFSADGKARLWSNGDILGVYPSGDLEVARDVYCTVVHESSDRHLKEHLAPVDPSTVLEDVLALPISRWNFIKEPTTDHVGPMAQDFYKAFKLGVDDKHIATVDADGVALAAIQGLNQKLEERLEQKDQEIQSLKERLERLESK